MQNVHNKLKKKKMKAEEEKASGLLAEHKLHRSYVQ